MRRLSIDIARWPRTHSGEYVFQSTEEALFFGRLAAKDKQAIAVLKRGRSIAITKVSEELKKLNPNYDKAFMYALRAQYNRESLEEAERVKKEVKK